MSSFVGMRWFLLIFARYCSALLFALVSYPKLFCACRAGLKPMQPMQLHWTPRHGVWVDCSFLPDTPCTWEFSSKFHC